MKEFNGTEWSEAEVSLTHASMAHHLTDGPLYVWRNLTASRIPASRFICCLLRHHSVKILLVPLVWFITFWTDPSVHVQVLNCGNCIVKSVHVWCLVHMFTVVILVQADQRWANIERQITQLATHATSNHPHCQPGNAPSRLWRSSGWEVYTNVHSVGMAIAMNEASGQVGP